MTLMLDFWTWWAQAMLAPWGAPVQMPQEPQPPKPAKPRPTLRVVGGTDVDAAA